MSGRDEVHTFKLGDTDPAREQEDGELLMDAVDLASDQNGSSWIEDAATGKRLAMIIPVDEAERLLAGEHNQPAWEDKEGDTLTNHEILLTLQSYRLGGVLEYITPTDPFGQEWVLGINGKIVKLRGKSEAVAFLLGAQLLMTFRTGTVRGNQTLQDLLSALP